MCIHILYFEFIYTHTLDLSTEYVAMVVEEKGCIIWYITIAERLVSRTSITAPTTTRGNVCETRAKTIVLVGELFMCGFRLWQAERSSCVELSPQMVRVCVCVYVRSLIESCQLCRWRDLKVGWGRGVADVEVGRTRKLDYVPNPGRWVVCFHAAATRQFIIVSCFSPLSPSVSLSLSRFSLLLSLTCLSTYSSIHLFLRPL